MTDMRERTSSTEESRDRGRTAVTVWRSCSKKGVIPWSQERCAHRGSARSALLWIALVSCMWGTTANSQKLELSFEKQPDGEIKVGTDIAVELKFKVDGAAGNADEYKKLIEFQLFSGENVVENSLSTPTLEAKDDKLVVKNLQVLKSGKGYRLRASVRDKDDKEVLFALSDLFDVARGDAHHLGFRIKEDWETRKATLADATIPEFSVVALDMEGNVDERFNDDITVALVPESKGVLKGGMTEKAVNGIATFRTLSLSEAGAFRLEATSEKIKKATSPAFLIAERFPSISLVVSPGGPVLLGAAFEVKVILSSPEGSLTRSQQDDYEIASATSSDAGSITVTSYEDLSLAAKAGGRGAATLEVTVKRKTDGETKVARLRVDIESIKEFRPLTVSLDMMDRQSVERLFGKVFNGEFFALRTRLFNNLGAEPGQRYAGGKILVYSDSLEVGVTFEKKALQKSSGGGKWEEVTLKDVLGVLNNALINPENPEGTGETLEPISGDPIKPMVVDPQFVKGDLVDLKALRNGLGKLGKDSPLKKSLQSIQDSSSTQAQRTDDDPAGVPGLLKQLNELVKGPLLSLNPDYKDAALKLFPEESGLATLASSDPDLCAVLNRKILEAAFPGAFRRNTPPLYLRHRFRYRPYCKDIMTALFESRKDTNSRARAGRLVSVLATVGTSYATIAGLDKSPTVAASIAAFNGVLIPGLEKYWPDLRAAQRQNILNLAMRELEEVPFGSDISRIIFIPRKPFTGFLREYSTRIGEVHTSYFKVRVAVIAPGSSTTIEAQPE